MTNPELPGEIDTGQPQEERYVPPVTPRDIEEIIREILSDGRYHPTREIVHIVVEKTKDQVGNHEPVTRVNVNNALHRMVEAKDYPIYRPRRGVYCSNPKVEMMACTGTITNDCPTGSECEMLLQRIVKDVEEFHNEVIRHAVINPVAMQLSEEQIAILSESLLGVMYTADHKNAADGHILSA